MKKWSVVFLMISNVCAFLAIWSDQLINFSQKLSWSASIFLISSVILFALSITEDMK